MQKKRIAGKILLLTFGMACFLALAGCNTKNNGEAGNQTGDGAIELPGNDSESNSGGLKAEPTATPTPTPTETPAPTQAATPDTEVVTATIVVERGNTATVVCNKVEAAGIIEDAKVLRKYLIDNQLTDYINIGSYTLSSDMSMKEIAEVLTKH